LQSVEHQGCRFDGSTGKNRGQTGNGDNCARGKLTAREIAGGQAKGKLLEGYEESSSHS
jgi:hypothetical protein